MQTQCPCCGHSIDGELPVVDLGLNFIAYRGHSIRLQPMQAELMFVLVRAWPNTMLVSELYHALWGDFEPTHAQEELRVHVCNIRKRLHKTGIIIKCAWSRGYRLVLPNQNVSYY